MSPVIAIGLDAADPELVDAWTADGTMPALAALRARGVGGPVDSAGPYRAETPWTTFACGLGPERTGYWGPIRYNPRTSATDEVGAYGFAQWPPFYVELPGRACIFDLPQTRLRPDVAGVQVLGWGSHSQQGPSCSEPPELLPSLVAAHGGSPVDDETATPSYDREALDRFAEDVRVSLARRAVISADLLRREPWSLFLTVVGETHAAGHELWHHGRLPHPLASADVDRIRETYAGTDAVIDALVQAAPPDATLFVFSLHGMVANALDVPSMALLPEVLARWSFGEPFLAAGVMPPPPPRHDHRDHWKHEVWRLRTARGEAELAGPEALMAAGDVLHWQPAQWYRAHWPRMRAFALPSYADGTIRFNLRGREGCGTVGVNQTDELAAELTDLLTALRCARTGRPVVEAVQRCAAVPGEHAPPADLLVVWADAAVTDAFVHPELGAFGPFPFFRTGGHRSRGFWTAAGRGIGAGEGPTARIEDLSATLRHLAGGDPLPWLPGQVLLSRRSAVA